MLRSSMRRIAAGMFRARAMRDVVRPPLPENYIGDVDAKCIVAVVGLSFEAKIAAGMGAMVICRSPGHAHLVTMESLTVENCSLLLSFGVAGGLAPDLRPGDWVIASEVIDGTSRHCTDRSTVRRLLDLVPQAEYAPVVGLDLPLCDRRSKQSLFATQSAVAVDMESHLVARLARQRQIPFATLRVIIDPAHRSLPEAAIAGLGPDGSTNLTGVLRSLLNSPGQVPDIARIMVDAYRAQKSLRAVRRDLGEGLNALRSWPERAAAQLP